MFRVMGGTKMKCDYCNRDLGEDGGYKTTAYGQEYNFCGPSCALAYINEDELEDISDLSVIPDSMMKEGI